LRTHIEIKLARPRMKRIHWIRDYKKRGCDTWCDSDVDKCFSFYVLNVIGLVMSEQICVTRKAWPVTLA